MNISYKNLLRRENRGNQMYIFLPFYNRNPALKMHITSEPCVTGSLVALPIPGITGEIEMWLYLTVSLMEYKRSSKVGISHLH